MVLWSFDEKAAQWRLGIMSVETGKLLPGPELSLPPALSPWAFVLPDWSLEDDALLFTETHDGVSNLWKLPLNGGPRTPVTHFTSDMIWNFAFAPDGTLFLARGNIESDAILIRNFR
jgi:hypothetical protein